MTDSTATTFARHYAERGWSPVPIPYRGKRPVLSKWQDLRITAQTIGSYFNGKPMNVGVILGPASKGLTDADCDCPEAVRLAQRFLPATGFIFGRKSNPASHRCYLCSPLPAPVQFRDPTNGKMIIEFRSGADSGQQTVFPGSVHTTGEPVEFVAGASEPAEEDGNFLLALVSKTAAAALLARHSPSEGARHDFGLALAGGLARVGWDVEDVAEFVGAVCDAGGHNDLDDRESGARDTCERVKRGDKATGWPTLARIIGKDGKNVVAKAAEWLGIDRRQTEQEDGGTDESERIPLPLPLTVRELVAAYPALQPPLIHGVLRVGETMNVIASPKTGKSWLVLQLAIAVATGRMWLDQFPTEAGDVLIVDNELHGATSASRVPKVAAAMGVTTDEYADRISVLNLRGHLQDIFSLGKLFASFEPGRFKLIIIDAFYRALPIDTDENDNGTMAQLYNAIDNYSARLGCAFVLIHHTSKGIQGGKSVTDVGSGAGAQSRAADAHVVLRQHEVDGIVVLDGVVRSWAPLNPICLQWEFPRWRPAPDHDPAILRVEGRKRNRKEEEQANADAPVAWTVEAFVGRFISDKGRTADEIHIDAEAADLSQKKSERFLGAAVASGKAFKWEMGSKAKALYSTQKQATLLPAIDETPKSSRGKGKR